MFTTLETLCTQGDFRFHNMTLLTLRLPKTTQYSSSPLNTHANIQWIFRCFYHNNVCLSQNKAEFTYLVLAGDNGCYLEGFYLEDTKDNLHIMQR